MDEEYVYTDKDFQDLQEALDKSNMICYGRPDQFQYYQNELSKNIARFLLLPYLEKRKKNEE